MTSPNPALVTQRAAQRLPRVALLLLCAAYVLPGMILRDPWRNADITAFGYMLSLAHGDSPWLAPTIAGLPSDAALLPYWLGAAFIDLLGPLLGDPMAARVPFALLLIATLALAWYTTYFLARSDAAQPLPFAFGGEADPVDYARAIADGALLALIASLGLLQLGHETTPELGQLASVSLFMFAMAASPFRSWQSRVAMLASLPALAASGAPSMAAALGIGGTLVAGMSSHAEVRRFTPWVVASALGAIALAFGLGAWGWRLATFDPRTLLPGLLKQWVWFLWPVWPLALWTLWRWRRQLRHRHIVMPLICAGVAVVSNIGMGGSDRALMLALPPLAVLAAFSLPTLQRSTAAALDWFSVFFFSAAALTIWIFFIAMQTGVPPKLAGNVLKLAPGFVPGSPWAAATIGALGSIAWLWLVRWRTGRNRHPLWKSLVLPASGVALCWLLAMTLWLPLSDYTRSYRPLIDRIARHVPRDACVATVDLPRGQLVALEHFGHYRLDALSPPSQTRCRYLLRIEPRTEARGPRPAQPSGWKLVARESRPTARDEITAIYRRAD